MIYKKLEERYAAWIGTKYAVACNSGTSALHLALIAIGVGRGDEVIVPEFTMAATAFAVSYTGARPVFVDCDDTLNIDPTLIEAAITKRTKAIMPVHVYGKPANMRAIKRIAKEHNLKVIEDAAEAHGAIYQGKMVGSIGDLGCFSFYKNKIIAAEEGGIVCTNNKEYYERMKTAKCMAFTPDHDFMHLSIGYNYRMPDSQARKILKQMDRIDEIMEKRRNPDGSVNWVRPFIYANQEERDGTMEILSRDGYENPRHFFKPMSMLPMYRKKHKHLKAYYYSTVGMYLPLTNRMLGL